MLRDPELESKAIYLVTLAGNEATLENIENALSRLFRDSEALGISGRTRLFVYITGEGNDQNMMHLPNNEVLSKEDVNQWLWKLRATWGYSRTITLVLDICRTNENDPHVNMHDGTELVFSCSPGEEALALKFSRDTPHSCFMLAFVLASPISARCSSAKLVATVEQRLGQLTEIGREAALNAGKGGEVSGPQQPNWAQRSVSDVRFRQLLFSHDLFGTATGWVNISWPRTNAFQNQSSA
ncbi:hypothetical protein RSOLAG1IB_01682 [Rhizoctonia solani AG-1 IB]|uniref:Uncharacterized protein n=1 Tax=Thanatephorus cucumeris (strain AG1-IB / isolate 7/3/14) TaxID=1108050 RepID=A0A0B7FDJ5_THACB|nr:hypothetical protein RSOLAG1IB_01682 [Rhizoctonia solani AG-1 IB]